MPAIQRVYMAGLVVDTIVHLIVYVVAVQPRTICIYFDLSSAIIIGSTVLQCLVNSVSFIRLSGVYLVVIEWQTLSGSRHLAKYCAYSSPGCP